MTLPDNYHDFVKKTILYVQYWGISLKKKKKKTANVIVSCEYV